MTNPILLPRLPPRPREKRACNIWTKEEVEKWANAVCNQKNTEENWAEVARAVPCRTNSQCREKWTRYVKRLVKERVPDQTKGRTRITPVDAQFEGSAALRQRGSASKNIAMSYSGAWLNNRLTTSNPSIQ